MAAPNLLNATSIYGKNVTASGDGSLNIILTCATDKLIKITGINVHSDGTNLSSKIFISVINLAASPIASSSSVISRLS